MKGFCLFSGSKVTNNEEFRKQLQAKNKCLLGLILLGIISAAAAYYMEFSGKMKVDDYMLGVFGLLLVGIAVGVHAGQQEQQLHLLVSHHLADQLGAPLRVVLHGLLAVEGGGVVHNFNFKNK